MSVAVYIKAAPLGEERPRLVEKVDLDVYGPCGGHAGEHEAALKPSARLAFADADDTNARESGARRHEAGKVELEIGGSIGGILDAAAAHDERGGEGDEAAYSSHSARFRIHLSASPVSWNQDMP